MNSEAAFTFDCGGAPLVGILHPAAQGGQRGVVIVVGGGPQYRAGGHRQLTLWSRVLAATGTPVLRFDYTGMGDSHGRFRGFEQVQDDIRAAIDALLACQPELREVVLWGECDAASAILFYAWQDPRVRGAVLLNPWVRTAAGEAKAILRSYYASRLMQPSFWRKVLTLRFNPLNALRSAVGIVRRARSASPSPATPPEGATLPEHLPLPARLLEGLRRFSGPVMLVLSGRDLVAREFEEVLRASPDWQAALARGNVTRHDLADADHTFSSAAQRATVVNWGLEWLRSW